jgi:hypothetical protein
MQCSKLGSYWVLFREPLINAVLLTVVGFGASVFGKNCPFDGDTQGCFGRCRRQADASVLRARYRLASARSENTCAPFLAMPR